MTTITKELNLLDIQDIEEALSIYLDKEISLSDVECILRRFVTEVLLLPEKIVLEFSIDEPIGYDEPILSLEIFSNEKDVLYWKGRKLSLNEPFLPVEQIFNFDVSSFKSFGVMTEIVWENE